jgi:hypothetical protein
MAACEECGYIYEELATTAIAGSLRSFGPRYREVFADINPMVVPERPAALTWSALEYCCHVRDVLLVQRERAVLAQIEECPSFPRMHRDERVALCGYSAGPLGPVLDQLEMAADLCAAVFGAIEGHAWDRRFVYNWPTAAEHDLAWLGRHTVHEGEHHLMDVGRVLAAVVGRPGASAHS